MLEEYKKDIGNDLLDFVASPQFDKFKKIIFQMYLSRLTEFQNSSDDKDLSGDKKALNIYLNLARTMEIMANEVMENKRAIKEKTLE